jgi:hypothetical protein
MRKTLMATALGLQMAFVAVSGFAATAAKPLAVAPQLSPAAEPLQLSGVLPKEIFLAGLGAKPAPRFFIDNGSCSWTCDPCNTSADCPLDEFGRRQTCLSECP